MSELAVTWWGHSSTTVELGSTVVATDPLLVRRLYHLRRSSPPPPVVAAGADVVLVSHLHHDHLHLPSLDRFDPDVPVVVPRGAPSVLPSLRRRRLVEVAPGDSVRVGALDLEVLPARHDGRRDHFRRAGVDVPAIGFRLRDGERSVWFPGDTGVMPDFEAVAPVDLALVPIGGWGPSLGDDHLDPEQAAAAVAAVGARWALAVHYGTFWPITLRRLKPANHRWLFVTPPQRYLAAMAGTAPGVVPLTPAFAERTVLDPVPASGQTGGEGVV